MRQRAESPGEQAARIMALGRATAPLLRGDTVAVEHGDLLYDERGLPR